MRMLLILVGLLAFGGIAEAQQLAQVNTVARVRIPDFLILKTGEVSEQTLADGSRVRRVTLYVTANREWNLAVARNCGSNCSEAAYTVSKSAGKSCNEQAVVVEYVWTRDKAAPASNEFEYLLVGA